MNLTVNQEHLLKVLLAPHISEKSTLAADRNGQYVFKVLPTANKQEISRAVELLFEVKVSSVQVVNVKGKNKIFGRMRGKRKDWKKAYVKLAEGHQINFVGQQKA